jgi:peptidoglycan/LPS O-acetylase OafA/YrhL
MQSTQANNRIHGLDILRSSAIILVFMYHYMCFVSKQPTFGLLSNIGWVGVDLFFVLSGYLIGHQIFSPIAGGRKYSFKIFYSRRLLRTLPNYLFILGVYFFIPGFSESVDLPPLWKFLTFTQNFDLHTGTGFSHAWSLCIEEQFYLILPLLALLIIYLKSIRVGWAALFGFMIVGIILRSYLWIHYSQYSDKDFGIFYYTKIYYSSFCRLDELIIGVSIAMLRNFHKNTWLKVIEKGNLIFLFGIIATSITFYMFLHY